MRNGWYFWLVCSCVLTFWAMPFTVCFIWVWSGRNMIWKRLFSTIPARKNTGSGGRKYRGAMCRPSERAAVRFFISRERRSREKSLWTGFREVIRILKNAGADGSAVPDRRKDAGRIEFKRDAERVFEQYQKYRETYPNSVQPMPEGDCAVCPDCRGKGLLLKKLPLLKVDVGKVCKTCGGSGYLPQ